MKNKVFLAYLWTLFECSFSECINIDLRENISILNGRWNRTRRWRSWWNGFIYWQLMDNFFNYWRWCWCHCCFNMFLGSRKILQNTQKQVRCIDRILIDSFTSELFWKDRSLNWSIFTREKIDVSLTGTGVGSLENTGCGESITVVACWFWGCVEGWRKGNAHFHDEFGGLPGRFFQDFVLGIDRY